MIRFILLSCLTFFSSLAISQQSICTLDSTLIDTNFVILPLPLSATRPDGGITDSACLNKPFSFDFQFRVPDEITLSGNTLGLDSIFISPTVGITGLPMGMDYSCNPPNCRFGVDSLISGCLIIYGTPTEKGDFSISITTELLTSLGTFGPVTLPNSAVPNAEGEYILTVLDEDAPNCFIDMTSASYDVLGTIMSLENAPNPFQNYTQITINSTVNDELNFQIFDLVGRQIHNEKINVFKGKNTFEYNASSLTNGIYVFTISNQDGWISKKMIVSK